MPEANTRYSLFDTPCFCLPREFNGLHAAAVWHGGCQYQSQEAKIPASSLETGRNIMFDGKNNRLLDSFSFRIALTAAVFVLWSGAGYALLSLL
jgi:hypothetical protein